MVPPSPTGHLSPDGLPSVAVRELASGVDAFYLSGWADLPEALLARLEVGKGQARTVEGPVPFVFGGIEFGLSPGGLHKYAYRLSHEYGELAVTASRYLPPRGWSLALMRSGR
jgi:hypothetical protein